MKTRRNKTNANWKEEEEEEKIRTKDTTSREKKSSLNSFKKVCCLSFALESSFRCYDHIPLTNKKKRKKF